MLYISKKIRGQSRSILKFKIWNLDFQKLEFKYKELFPLSVSIFYFFKEKVKGFPPEASGLSGESFSEEDAFF